MGDAPFDVHSSRRHGDEAAGGILTHVEPAGTVREAHPKDSAKHEAVQVVVMDVDGATPVRREEKALGEQAGAVPGASQVRHLRCRCRGLAGLLTVERTRAGAEQ